MSSVYSFRESRFNWICNILLSTAVIPCTPWLRLPTAHVLYSTIPTGPYPPLFHAGLPASGRLRSASIPLAPPSPTPCIPGGPPAVAIDYSVMSSDLFHGKILQRARPAWDGTVLCVFQLEWKNRLLYHNPSLLCHHLGDVVIWVESALFYRKQEASFTFFFFQSSF